MPSLRPSASAWSKAIRRPSGERLGLANTPGGPTVAVGLPFRSNHVNCDLAAPFPVCATKVPLLATPKRARSICGRNTGQRWLDSKRDASSLVISMGVPPEDDNRYIPVNTLGEKRIVPSAFQVPPRPLGASPNTCTSPPERSAFLSFPLAKNPRDRSSGDQKG